MKSKTEDKDKIKLSRIISNVWYIYKFAIKHDRKMCVSYLAGRCFRSAVSTFLNTYMIKFIIDVMSDGANIRKIIWLLTAQFLMNALMLSVHIVSENLFFTRMVRVSGQIQRKLMDKARRVDLACYDIPEYFNDFVIAASQSEDMVTKCIMCTADILAHVIAMAVAGSMIFTVNAVVALFPIVGFVINIVTRFRITKLEYKYSLEMQRIGRKGDYSRRVFYQPEYAKEIKLTGIEDALIEQFEEAMTEQKAAAKSYGIKIALLSLVNWIGTFTLCQYFAVPVYLAHGAMVEKSISLADVASLRNATDRIKSDLDGMNYSLVSFQEVGQFAEKFRRFVELETKIEECKGSVPMPKDGGVIELKNVGFKYKDDEGYVLKNINMTVRKGEKLALVGENGAGKTTLIKLIMRLYDVTEGSITYGGVDIRELDTHEYRQAIGAVFQDFQIYGATLGENVKTDFVADSDRQTIVNALDKADLGGKLKTLPDGIDTELTKEFSDDSAALSGGEGQKVAVSRMFMRDDMTAAILDEPSSALDPIAEYRLNRNMLDGSEGRAIILISHRLSTTKDADRIILLSGGQICESGTHSELMSAGGKYAEMWRVQAEKYHTEIYA